MNDPKKTLRRATRPRPLQGLAAACLAAAAATPAAAQDPFADAVHEVTLGTNGGFNADLLPDIVLGPPRGTGLIQGSFDVLALGVGGEIVLYFDDPAICDGPGVDFTIFENAFHSGSPTGPIFDEVAYVAASEDGETFFEFPYDAETKAGLAGRGPVLSNPDNGIDPTDPAVSGGDSFDLAAIGLAAARYIRITDVAGAIPDVGDLPPFLPPPNAGFDLDAVAAVHICDRQPTATPTYTVVPPTPSHTGAVETTPTPSAPATPLEPSATTTATVASTATRPPPSATATSPLSTATPGLPGDVDGNGVVDDRDVDAVIAAIFAGDEADERRADVNGDLRIDAADVVEVSARRGE